MYFNTSNQVAKFTVPLQGIGLYLARTNLHTIGYQITASNDKKYNELKGACFVIEELEGM
ncbi:hypothetical protein [Vibrio ruber]|uniref:hypothetical protein n=1 Tax=Vibrio ruber TaxID=184755 RepID=UPI0011154D67|nr:hypothetical protein [Vibrio ruber]